MSAFGWKDDPQSCAISQQNLRSKGANGASGYARFSPKSDLHAGLWNVVLRLESRSCRDLSFLALMDLFSALPGDNNEPPVHHGMAYARSGFKALDIHRRLASDEKDWAQHRLLGNGNP